YPHRKKRVRYIAAGPPRCEPGTCKGTPPQSKEKPKLSPLKRSTNIAARMGRWSASHWKTATFGWLAFVIAAVMLGGQFGTTFLEDTDTNVGEAKTADKIVEAGFPASEDEQGEIVFI